MTLNPQAHLQSPQAMGLVGRMLVDYGELEISLLNCVQGAYGDFNGVFKAMFRTRGEEQRIKIADALGRDAFTQLGFVAHFDEAIDAMGYAREVRNQYAHAYWAISKAGTLSFVGLERLAKEKAVIVDLASAKQFPVDVALLADEHSYFEYVGQLIDSLNWAAQYKLGRSKVVIIPKPGFRPKPLKHL